MSQQVSVDKLLCLRSRGRMNHYILSDVYLCVCAHVPYVVDHQVHDGLGDQVSDSAVDDGQVRVHQVPDDLHLSLQLRI